MHKLGGAGGGSDFDPKGKSESEVKIWHFLKYRTFMFSLK